MNHDKDDKVIDAMMVLSEIQGRNADQAHRFTLQDDGRVVIDGGLNTPIATLHWAVHVAGDVTVLTAMYLQLRAEHKNLQAEYTVVRADFQHQLERETHTSNELRERLAEAEQLVRETELICRDAADGYNKAIAERNELIDTCTELRGERNALRDECEELRAKRAKPLTNCWNCVFSSDELRLCSNNEPGAVDGIRDWVKKTRGKADTCPPLATGCPGFVSSRE